MDPKDCRSLEFGFDDGLCTPFSLAVAIAILHPEFSTEDTEQAVKDLMDSMNTSDTLKNISDNRLELPIFSAEGSSLVNGIKFGYGRELLSVMNEYLEKIGLEAYYLENYSVEEVLKEMLDGSIAIVPTILEDETHGVNHHIALAIKSDTVIIYDVGGATIAVSLDYINSVKENGIPNIKEIYPNRDLIFPNEDPIIFLKRKYKYSKRQLLS